MFQSQFYMNINQNNLFIKFALDLPYKVFPLRID